MEKIALLSTVIGSFLIITFSSPALQAQTLKGNCTTEVLAMNSETVIAAKAHPNKKPCPKKEKRINQRPAAKADQGLFYYRDVELDQVTETYINTFPETATHVEESLRSMAEKDVPQKLSCKHQSKKPCTPKKEERKRVRPSATVKLVKY